MFEFKWWDIITCEEGEGESSANTARVWFFFFHFASHSRKFNTQEKRVLSLVYKSNFYTTIFMWQFLFVRVDEENWPIFMCQIHLLKSLRVSFYVTNQSCHIRKIARVDESSHKMRGMRGRLSSRVLFLRISAVQSHYWRTKLWIADKYLLRYLQDQIYLSHKNCSCRRSLRILRFQLPLLKELSHGILSYFGHIQKITFKW